MNTGPGADGCDDGKFAVRLRADTPHGILVDFRVVEKIQLLRPRPPLLTVPAEEREFRRHKRFQLGVVLGVDGVVPGIGQSHEFG